MREKGLKPMKELTRTRRFLAKEPDPIKGTREKLPKESLNGKCSEKPINEDRTERFPDGYLSQIPGAVEKVQI